MTTPQRGCGDDATLVGSLERILYERRRIAASSDAPVVRNPSNVHKLLEASLKEVATPVLRVDGEKKFGAFADRSL